MSAGAGDLVADSWWAASVVVEEGEYWVWTAVWPWSEYVAADCVVADLGWGVGSELVDWES